MKKRDVLSNRVVYAIASSLILAFMLTGCTTAGPTYSGWLKTDYAKLTEDPEHEGSMTWIESNEVIKNYNKVMIDPVVVYIDPDIGEVDQRADQEVIKKITAYMRDTLVKEFSKGYEVVDEPGKNVVRIRMAITSVLLTDKELTALNYIPVALVLTAAGEATGIRDNLAVINMEGEVLDSLTGRRIALVVQRKALETGVQSTEELKAKDVYPTLDYWAKKAKKKFDRAHGK